MRNTSKNKKSFSRRLKRFLLVFLLLFLFLNLIVFITGKTYLYKGIQETYLKGKTGPGIYDSIVFPVRIAPQSKASKEWNVKAPMIELNQKSIEGLNETKTSSFLIDGKSTRLNSSHVRISYAVFCLK